MFLPKGGGFVNITDPEGGPTATSMIPEGGTTEKHILLVNASETFQKHFCL